MIRDLLAADTGEDMSPRKAVIREQARANFHSHWIVRARALTPATRLVPCHTNPSV